MRSSAPEPKRDLRHPLPPGVPNLPGMRIAGRYRSARVGGDFFDFIPLENSRLLFILMDIAGQRDEALHLASQVQDVVREQGPELLGKLDSNQPEAIVQLLLTLNRRIMEASSGICHVPSFIGCYDDALGLLSYGNAGHLPALVKDQGGVTSLVATGLPLGLFSHVTHEVQVAVLTPASSMVLVSKGLTEARAGHEEFGIERVKNILENVAVRNAEEFCQVLLDDVAEFVKKPSRFGPQFHLTGFAGNPEGNDITALTLVRQGATL